jgi:hypothetical protein
VTPGNYQVEDGNKATTSMFSVNVKAEECQLVRVPVERIEAVLGPNTLLPLDRKVPLTDALRDHWKQPVELLPSLMLLLLVTLAVENLLANKFYRRDSNQQPVTSPSPGAAPPGP